MGGSGSLEVVRNVKGTLLVSGVACLVMTIYGVILSVELHIVPMFNSVGNLLWGMLWLGGIFLTLLLFSFCIRNYTLWDANETRLLEETKQMLRCSLGGVGE